MRKGGGGNVERSVGTGRVVGYVGDVGRKPGGMNGEKRGGRDGRAEKNLREE